MVRCAVLRKTLRLTPNLTGSIHKYIIYVQPPRGTDHRTVGDGVKSIYNYIGILRTVRNKLHMT